MTPDRFARLRATLVRRQPDLTVLADNTQKAHNINAIVRTCDATGIFELNAVTSDSPLRRHHMISGGSHKWVRIRHHVDSGMACEDLQRRGFRILAAHVGPQARDFRAVDYTRPCAVALGSELYGVSESVIATADEHIAVAMQGMVESLNVSVAAAIILFEAQRQREAAGLYEESRLPREVFDTTLFEWCYPDIARRCRDKGLAYPPLGPEGELTRNPFAIDGHASTDPRRVRGR